MKKVASWSDLALDKCNSVGGNHLPTFLLNDVSYSQSSEIISEGKLFVKFTTFS
jgi:hypothetical protein